MTESIINCCRCVTKEIKFLSHIGVLVTTFKPGRSGAICNSIKDRLVDGSISQLARWLVFKVTTDSCMDNSIGGLCVFKVIPGTALEIGVITVRLPI